jgi:hypothetical protein
MLLAFEAISVYPGMWLRMRRLPVRAIIGSNRAVRGRPRVALASAAERELVARRLGGAVNQTLSVLPTDSRCLIQALVLDKMLAVRGVECTIVIGTRADAHFEAHAWVECEGVAVLPALGFRDHELVRF